MSRSDCGLFSLLTLLRPRSAVWAAFRRLTCLAVAAGGGLPSGARWLNILARGPRSCLTSPAVHATCRLCVCVVSELTFHSRVVLVVWFPPPVMSTPPYRTVVVKLPVFIGPCVSASCCDTFSLCFLWTLPLSLFFMCQTHTLLIKHLLSAAAAAWSCCQDYHVSNRRKVFPLTRGSNTLASWLLALSLNSCADPFLHL